MKQRKDELEALINAADASVRKAANKSSRLTPMKQRKYSQASVLLAVCFAVWGYMLWSSSISDGQIRMDLEKLILSARTQVEERMATEGRLPDALPDLALSKVVRYEILDAETKHPRYRLIAEINGVSERWSSN